MPRPRAVYPSFSFVISKQLHLPIPRAVPSADLATARPTHDSYPNRVEIEPGQGEDPFMKTFDNRWEGTGTQRQGTESNTDTQQADVHPPESEPQTHIMPIGDDNASEISELLLDDFDDLKRRKTIKDLLLALKQSLDRRFLALRAKV